MGFASFSSSRAGTVTRRLLFVASAVMAGMIGYREYRRHTCILQFSEAEWMLQSIRMAEEAYRSESVRYLGCDADGADAVTEDVALLPLFPRAETQLDVRKVEWAPEPYSLGSCWRTLDIRPHGPVRCGYAVVATHGREPTFTARAVCDTNGDGKRVEYRISSETHELTTLGED